MGETKASTKPLLRLRLHTKLILPPSSSASSFSCSWRLLWRMWQVPSARSEMMKRQATWITFSYSRFHDSDGLVAVYSLLRVPVSSSVFARALAYGLVRQISMLVYQFIPCLRQVLI